MEDRSREDREAPRFPQRRRRLRRDAERDAERSRQSEHDQPSEHLRTLFVEEWQKRDSASPPSIVSRARPALQTGSWVARLLGPASTPESQHPSDLLLHGLHVDLDLDAVADQNAAGLQRLI